MGETTNVSPRKGVKVVAAGSILILPAESSYDRQVAAEHISALLRRHGALRLSAGRRVRWLTVTDGSPAGCQRCRRPLDCAVELTGGEIACVTCACRGIVADHAESQRPAA